MTDNIEMLPKTLTKQLYVTLCTSGYRAGELEVWDQEMSGEDRISIMDKEVTFKLPKNMDVKGKVIAGLEAEKEKIQAELHMKIKGIQEKIDSLLSIENHATK